MAPQLIVGSVAARLLAAATITRQGPSDLIGAADVSYNSHSVAALKKLAQLGLLEKTGITCRPKYSLTRAGEDELDALFEAQQVAK